MQVRGVARFLKGKVTLSQSEGTHQFLSPETILTKGGGEKALQDSPSYALASNFSISNKILENFQ